MALWAVEEGTFWAVEPGRGLPPRFPARVEAEFLEIKAEDADALAAAMEVPSPEPILQRFQSGRRCFALKPGNKIAAYGWVTQGEEWVGEMDRAFHFGTDEAYLWDCGTVAAWRKQRLYSSLLNQIIYRLHEEGVARLWIGASRHNQPSIRGFANAGFKPVLDITYRRLWRITTLWVDRTYPGQQALLPAAYRILVDHHERRFGRIAIGYKAG